MKTLTILCCLCAVFSTVYGRPYAYGQEDEAEKNNLLTELITRMMVTTQDNINAETLALKFAAIQAVAEAAKADPCFIRNCPPGGKWTLYYKYFFTEGLMN